MLFEKFLIRFHDRTGISLSEKKLSLVQTRLRPRILQVGFNNLDEYLNYIFELDNEHSEWQQLTNAITTNKTFFFREQEHFNYLNNIFIDKWLKRNNSNPLLAWSAACSTGEEPYSLAMTLNHKIANFKILATDIDTEVLNIAANGVYPLSQLKAELPAEFYNTFIEQGTKDLSNWGRINRNLKNKIHFKQHNLIENTSPSEMLFDVVFLRNVMIYFSNSASEFILNKIYRTVKPGGLLIIGHAETLHHLNTKWKYLNHSIYIRD